MLKELFISMFLPEKRMGIILPQQAGALAGHMASSALLGIVAAVCTVACQTAD